MKGTSAPSGARHGVQHPGASLKSQLQVLEGEDWRPYSSNMIVLMFRMSVGDLVWNVKMFMSLSMLVTGDLAETGGVLEVLGVGLVGGYTG